MPEVNETAHAARVEKVASETRAALSRQKAVDSAVNSNLQMTIAAMARGHDQPYADLIRGAQSRDVEAIIKAGFEASALLSEP